MATAVTARNRAGGKQQPGSYSPMAALEVEPADETTPLRNKPTKPHGSSSRTAQLTSYSDPLVLESSTAFKALLITPLIVWWVAIGAGMWVYEGLPHGQKVYHVMLWFDKGLLRPAGPLVPFIVLLARAAVHWLAHWLRHGRQGMQQQRRGGATLGLGSLLMTCLVIYSAMAVARIAIYLTHFFLLKNRYLEFHIVSDHIFLAATMLICLHAEIICLMSDMLRAVKNSISSGGADAVSVREVVLTLLFVVALFLYLFTAADMYYTAKYFHFPLESFSTTVIVFILFQLPMLLWIVRQRRPQ